MTTLQHILEADNVLSLRFFMLLLVVVDMFYNIFAEAPHSGGVAMVCSSIYLFYVIFKIMLMSNYVRHLSGRWETSNWPEMLFVVVHWVVVFYSINGPEGLDTSTVDHRGHPLCKLLLAPILVCWSSVLQQTLRVTLLTIQDCLGTLLFCGVILMVYGYLGFICFAGVYNYKGDIPNDNFDGLTEGMLTDFVLMTTENYPSVVVQAYNHARGSLAYFMIGLILFIVMKDYLLGQVSDAFMARLQTQVRIAYSKELRGYAFAFLTITQRPSSRRSSRHSSRPTSPASPAMEADGMDRVSSGGLVLQPMTDTEWQALGLSSSPALSP